MTRLKTMVERNLRKIRVGVVTSDKMDKTITVAVDSISKRRKPFTVDYTGFGWVLIKKGVFENLEYPWFAPKMQVFESGAVQDMCGEDVSFCLDAIEKGFDIWCDPRIRVGHEKTRII